MFFTRLLTHVCGGFWRLKTRCNRTTFGPLRRLYLRIFYARQGADGAAISHVAQFAGVPCFPHGLYGIFISGGAKIGKNAVIFQHVTIGSNTLPDSKGLGSPVVGDNCYIGAGAKIIGNVRVGDNVRIGANCVVHADVPNNSVVVSGKQVVIPRAQVHNRFYSYHGRWVYYDNGSWKPETDKETLARLVAAFGLGGEAVAEAGKS